jgi:lysophospholipase L1-like esterase
MIRILFWLIVLAGWVSPVGAAESSSPPHQTGAAVAPADPATYLREFVGLAGKRWPKNRTLRVVCHGHSVPAGYFKTPAVHTLEAYPHLLHHALSQRFPHAVINVIVTAIGGEESKSGAARFDSDVLALRPDVVLIDYSLNDRRLGLPASREAWASMIQRCRDQAIPVLLLTPTPDTRARWQQPDDPLQQHAEQVRALAREYGVGLVDSLAAFGQAVSAGTDLDSLMSQINHPNQKGHQIVAREILKWFPAP